MENARDPYRVVPVVSPVSNDPNTSGRVRNLHVGGGVTHKQIQRAPNSPSGWAIEPSYGYAGWLLLQDVFIQENDLAGWERYKKYLDHWAKGLTNKSFPERWLPRLVQERRKSCAADEFADDFGGEEIAPEVRVKPTTGDTVPPEARPKPAKGAKPATEVDA